MVRRRAEAWLTYVASDNNVQSAMVLATSLRLTGTTKTISVIWSTAVSKASKTILREGFDETFLLDDDFISPDVLTDDGGKKDKNCTLLRAKIFAFSLQMYDKCIFLPAWTLALENCDELFGYHDGQDSLIRDLTDNMDVLVFTPKLALCKFLEEQRERQHGDDAGFLVNQANVWMENNIRGSSTVKNQDRVGAIVKLSLKDGLLMIGDGYNSMKIVHFVDIPETDDDFGMLLRSFCDNSDVGLTEKKLAEKWLTISESQNSGPCRTILTMPSCYPNDPIAIVGMSCRFPRSRNLEEFWKLMECGEEGICVPPAYRWKKEHSIVGMLKRERETEAGFLTVPVDEFDSKFFGISPKDAVFLDPQARILHEVLWEGLEDSGIDPLSLRGSHTGIFTGSWMNDYKDIIQTSAEQDFFRTYMGNGMGAIAARLSFLLGLTGPSIATESGCSSAIVAVDLAIKSLRSGETNLAIAGGVNLLLRPYEGKLNDHIIAEDGRCKTFDEKANGFGRAEGCGVLVLKRLSDALRDRDHIWATIRGSAITQEGISRSLGTPTVHCEAMAMQLALDDAGVRPEQVSFVETHGTGTAVGDPMEVAAIAKVYRSNARKDPLIIGSVKTNVGHTESCSGITGIIKAVLSMQHEMIPKHLNFDTLNPKINLDAIPALIPVEPIPWPKIQRQPRIAGVSSFGITGTDGHVVIEEAPDHSLPKFTVGLERPIQLMKFSAKSKEALDDVIIAYEKLFLDERHSLRWKDVAYSGNSAKASFSHRAFLFAASFEEAAAAIQSDKLLWGDTCGKELGKICFLFTGQGSQYEGLAKTLYETSPVFRLHFDQCNSILKRRYNLPLRETLWKSEGTLNALRRTIYSQTSIFCVEYCLLKLWESWGVKPDYVLGHSLGEFCAAVAAGIMTFEEALMLVAERSRLIDNLPRGSMLVIKASQPEVEKLMKNAKIELDYAAINSSEQTVVAGDTDKILALINICNEESVKAVVLKATHAFHSRHMDPILRQYRKIAETVKYSESRKCQWISGMKGSLLKNTDFVMNADYWVDHAREKVSFLEACNSLKQLNCQHFVEIGPQPVLSTFVMLNIDNQPVSCYPSLRRNANDWETILSSLGKLYLNGINVDWEGFDRPYDREKVASYLPFHPFHRKSLWSGSTCGDVPIHPLIGCPLSNASSLKFFQINLHLKSVPFIKDHCIGERIIMPGAAFAEMCLSAGHCVANSLTEALERPIRPVALENLVIEAPLALTENKHCRLQVIVDFAKDSLNDDSAEDRTSYGLRVKIFSQTNVEDVTIGKWQLHASATCPPVVAVQDVMRLWRPSRVTDLISNSEGLSIQSFYKRNEGVGLKFGDLFRSIQRYWGTPSEDVKGDVVTEVKLPADYDNYLLHPILIDAMIQTALLSSLKTPAKVLMVPVRIGKLIWLRDIGKPSALHLHATWENGTCFVFASDESLNPIAFMTDVQLTETNVKTIESILEQQNNHLPDRWEETWRPVPGPLDNRCMLPNLEFVFDTEEFTQRLQQAATIDAGDWEREIKTRRLIYLYQVKALLTLGWKPFKAEIIKVNEFCERHSILSMYRPLIHHYFTVCHDENGMMTFNEDDDLWQVESLPPSERELESEIGELNDNVKEEEQVRVISKIYRSVGERLHKFLSGVESPLHMLFPTDANERKECSAELYYENYPGNPDTIRKFTEMCLVIFGEFRKVNQNDAKAKLRVLEFGAGTGALTQHILPIFGEYLGFEFEYYCTDISGYFFTKAEKKFEAFRKNLKFCVFDVEKGGLLQGIPLNYFDLAVGADVLHATEDLEKTLGNLGDILRPGGTLFFSETVTQDRGMTFVFGLLEGYWRFKDFNWRPRHACVGADTWRRILLHCGYEHFHVEEAYMGTMGIITSSVSKSNMVSTFVRNRPANRCNWVIFGYLDHIHRDLIARLTRSGSINVTLVVPTIDDNNVIWTDTVCIKRVDLDSGDFVTQLDSILSEKFLHGIIYSWGMDTGMLDQTKIARPFLYITQKILTLKNAAKVYVCTRGVHPVAELHMSSNPSAATIIGMAKSLKNEYYDVLVRCLDLGDEDNREVVVDEILYELAMHTTSREKDRVQVAYRNSQRCEPRFCRAIMKKKDEEELQLPLCTDRYQLVLPGSKMIQDLHYEVLPEESLGEFEVEVKTKAYALNFKDILTILKPTEEFQRSSGVGIDFAGVVTRVGKGVSQENIKIADRVVGANTRDVPLRSHLILDSTHVIKVPDKMTYAEAATLPAVFATSMFCLHEVANMKKGETVLIHTGSGGVGLAAIQLARRCEANIITTAGSKRKRAYLKSLGIENVFHSRNTTYKEEILRVTHGRGVDIVLNSITGPGLKEASLDILARNGRFVEMSKLAVWTEAEVRERRPDVKYTIVDLTDEKQFSWRKGIKRIQECMKEDNVQPIPHVQFDALLIRQAFQFFQKARHIGKVVVTMPEVQTVEGQWKVKVDLFNRCSTYIITGGLGGIGFEVCKWMLEKGAANIVLVGRSPPKPEVLQEIDRYNRSKTGFNVTVKLGDVGNYEECKKIIDEIVVGDRPIRGIQHCAGVLRDNLYANQTWESFEATFNPKVEGTWNLHRLTEGMPLEHFVLYSSIAALAGTPGQASHAAANCFEDAFAHYRYSLGLPATTINWGQWSQVGSAKDVNISGILPVSVKRMLNGLELTLRHQMTQTCFGDVDSFHRFTIICPSFKYYLDERLRKSSHERTQIQLKSDEFWKEVDEAEGKLEVIMVYMKTIVREALRMEADETIDEDANMQDLGVDSLMMIELQNSMQVLMGSRLNITPTMLKDCHTVRQVSTAVVNAICGDDVTAAPLSPEEYTKLLEADCILEGGIHSTPAICGSARAITTVLITGVTGQLGPYVLSKIGESYKSVKKVVCLIRTKDGQCPKDKLENILNSMNLAASVDFNKVECVQGDLTLSQFGLSDVDYKNLAESVDAVIHLAVKANHVEAYRKYEEQTGDVRGVDVEGTLNILRFAATGITKYVYYASSLLSVVAGNNSGHLCDDWPEQNHIKTVAER